MGPTQQFSLRWNNYAHHITTAFDSLRSDEDLVDVTLSCEGRKIYAHKMLLSACSNYFKDVFKDNPCKHPVIIFRNVKYEDLLAIIDFMYHGEVSVEQEQLSSFLTTAEMLAVEGLSVCSTAPKEEIRKRQAVFMESPIAGTREATQYSQQSIKVASRPPGSQSAPLNIVHSPRPISPPRKRRLSPPAKPNNVERDLAAKKRVRETLKIESEEQEEEDGSFSEEAAMMELSQEEADSPSIKIETPHSPDDVGEKVAEQLKGQAGTSAAQDAAGNRELQEEEEEEYLIDEETAYVVMRDDGELQYIPAETLMTDEGEEQASSSRKPRRKMVVLQAVEDGGEGSGEAAEADESVPQGVEYIYAEGVSENNEIIIGEVPKYDCDQCGASFKRHDSLYKHQNMHTGRTACPVCGNVFSRITHRTRHMKIKHPDYPALPTPKRGRSKARVTLT